MFNDFRNMNEWMIAVVVGKCFLVLGFKGVVEFFGETFLNFCNEFVGAEAFETKRQQRTQQVGIFYIRCNGLSNAGVLHLHGNGSLLLSNGVNNDGAVYLANAGCSNRCWVPLHKEFANGFAEFFFHHLLGECACHWWCLRLQFGKCEAQWFGQAMVEVARHLAKFHECAFHIAEAVGNLRCVFHFT